MTVNPFDIAGQAEAIRLALEMPADERHRRLDALRGYVREHDLEQWVEAQLTDLDRVLAHARAGS